MVTDESYRQLMTVEARHGLSADLHEFIIDHSGVAYFTAYRHYITDLTRVGGPKHGTALDATVQGVDLATGDLVFDWRSAQPAHCLQRVLSEVLEPVSLRPGAPELHRLHAGRQAAPLSPQYVVRLQGRSRHGEDTVVPGRQEE